MAEFFTSTLSLLSFSYLYISREETYSWRTFSFNFPLENFLCDSWHPEYNLLQSPFHNFAVVKTFQCSLFDLKWPMSREDFLWNKTERFFLSREIKYSCFFSPVGPEFRGTKTVERVRLGQKAVLECDPRGDQPIRLSWSRHGHKISTQHQNYFKVSWLPAEKLMNCCCRN